MRYAMRRPNAIDVGTCQAAWETEPFVQTFWKDLRLGFRLIAKQPVFSFVAILALAIGIGANTTIFSMVNGVLLRPLPYRQPGDLYLIREVVPMMGRGNG